MTVLFRPRPVRSVLVTGQTGLSLSSTMLLSVLLLCSLFLNLMLFLFWWFWRWCSGVLAHGRPQWLVFHIIWESSSSHLLDHVHYIGAIAADLLRIFRKVLDLLPNKITHTELWCPRPHGCHQIPLKDCHI